MLRRPSRHRRGSPRAGSCAACRPACTGPRVHATCSSSSYQSSWRHENVTWPASFGCASIQAAPPPVGPGAPSTSTRRRHRALVDECVRDDVLPRHEVGRQTPGPYLTSSRARVLSATTGPQAHPDPPGSRFDVLRGGTSVSSGPDLLVGRAGPVTTCPGRGSRRVRASAPRSPARSGPSGRLPRTSAPAPVDRQVRDARRDVHEVARSHLLAVHEARPTRTRSARSPCRSPTRARLVRGAPARGRRAGSSPECRHSPRTDGLRRDPGGGRQALPSLVALTAADNTADGFLRPGCGCVGHGRPP